MTAENKWIVGIAGFFICGLFGFFVPIIWLLFLAGFIWLLASPNVQKGANAAAPQQTYQQYVESLAAETDTTDIENQIQLQIDSEQNPDVRSGLSRALEIVRAETPNQVVLNSAVTPQPVAMAPVELTEEQKHHQKKQQELRNVNIILYTASFLLVGAAVTFISFSQGVGDVAKFVLLLLVAVAFYISGLVLHITSERLRPAATAFVGTGLALVPFVGLALYSFVLPDAPIVWWVTSLVGLAGFIGAVIRIRSNIMAYLMLAFLFSTAASSAAALQAPLVWYFVSIIVVGSLLTYVSYKKPSWLPAHMTKPFEQNAQLAAPVALIGAIMAAGTFEPWDFALITGTATLHYLVNALGFATDKTRVPYWSAARALAIAFGATFAYALTEDWKAVFFVVTVGAVLSHFYSVNHLKDSVYEYIWLGVSQALLVVSLVAYFDTILSLSAQLLIIGSVSLYQLVIVRRVEYAVVGLLAGMALPVTVLRGVVDPAVPMEYVAATLLAIGFIAMALRAASATRHASFRYTTSIGYALFLAEAIIVSLFSGDITWVSAIVILSGVGLFISSFLERQPAIIAIANVVTAVGVWLLYADLFSSSTWVSLATGLTLAVIWYGLRWYFVSHDALSTANADRADIMMISSVSVLGLTSFISMFSSDQTVVAGSLVGCLAAGLLAYEANVRGALYLYEIALYITTFCLQRLVAFVYPDANILVYTHWWALSGILSILLYRRRVGDWAGTNVREIIVLSIISVPTGLYALVQPDLYQWLFLLEHVGLAVVGLLINKRLLVLWGAIGVGLGVLYLLQSYTYVLLTLVAVGLIGLAVWRLMKSK